MSTPILIENENDVSPVTVKAKRFWDDERKIVLDDLPSHCPLCHEKVYPACLSTVMLAGEARLQTAFQCVNETCRRIFIGEYQATGMPNQFALVDVIPGEWEPETFCDEIRHLSPMFVTIYNQVMQARALKLDQLTGVGLRKALEFLVKDFAKYLAPEKAEEIEKAFLSECIRTYIDDHKTKACADRAAWLGNDEAHYIRKWERQDIDDLLLLIRLVANGVENHLLTEKYIGEMPGRN